MLYIRDVRRPERRSGRLGDRHSSARCRRAETARTTDILSNSVLYLSYTVRTALYRFRIVYTPRTARAPISPKTQQKERKKKKKKRSRANLKTCKAPRTQEQPPRLTLRSLRVL